MRFWLLCKWAEQIAVAIVEAAFIAGLYLLLYQLVMTCFPAIRTTCSQVTLLNVQLSLWIQGLLILSCLVGRGWYFISEMRREAKNGYPFLT